MHVSLLGARLSHALVQDVATVEDQEQCMDAACPGEIFRASLWKEALERMKQADDFSRPQWGSIMCDLL